MMIHSANSDMAQVACMTQSAYSQSDTGKLKYTVPNQVLLVSAYSNTNLILPSLCPLKLHRTWPALLHSMAVHASSKMAPSWFPNIWIPATALMPCKANALFDQGVGSCFLQSWLHTSSNKSASLLGVGFSVPTCANSQFRHQNDQR